MIWIAADLMQELGIQAGLVFHPDAAPNPVFFREESHRIQARSIVEVLDQGVNPEDLLFVNQPSELEPIEWPGSKWVFVQGSSTLILGLTSYQNWRQLGISGVWAVLPHLQELIVKWANFPSSSVFCIPPYVESSGMSIVPWRLRPHELVLFPKKMYTTLGQADHAFLTAMLENQAKSLGWTVTQLENLTRVEVQQTFRRARLFINTNTMESLNATVIESMAEGCVVHTYNAIGGVDFLEDRVNARVFENLDVFAQLEAAVSLMKRPDEDEMERIQKRGVETANRFHRDRTKAAIADWWEKAIS